MDEYQTVDDLLKAMNLTEEEQLMHRSLINACRENERKITEYYASTRRNMERLFTVLENMSERVTVLSVALSDLLCETEIMSLRVMPSDKFYRE